MRDLTHTVPLATQTEDSERRRWIFENSHDGDLVGETHEYALYKKPMDFINEIVALAGPKAKLCPTERWSPGAYIETLESFISIFVGGRGDLFHVGRHKFTVRIVGSPQFVEHLFDELRTRYGESRLATVDWWYKTKDGLGNMTVPLEEPPQIYDAFYPFIKDGTKSYIKRFFDDRASVLFMMGPAGTGKTSLIRHMIYEQGLEAVITYDEELLGHDEMFVRFLTSSESSVLVVEDADLLVQGRETDGNKLIGRFLNVSDGIMKVTGKKLIFTTNLGDFRRVDPALVRPGRTFDALRFRKLTRGEAQRAAKTAGLPLPTEDRDYTLAELFNPEYRSTVVGEIGF